MQKQLLTVPEFAERAENVPFVEDGMGYDGWNCWGVVHCGFRDVLGIVLPKYDEHYASIRDFKELERIFNAEMEPWKQVPEGQEQAMDVAKLRIFGHPIHVGLVINSRGQMLHVDEGVNTCVESFRRAHWKRRYLGAFRYEPDSSKR
jgi:cell wall-associated NlpC family hydrolase